MVYGGIFLGELIILFILSQQLSRLLSLFFLRVTHSQTITINLLSLFFLPGIIVHELAHWFMASIVFVRTGEIEFFPQIQGNVVKLGSVAIAKTDPLRRFLIGVAPMIVGLGLMLLLFSFFAADIPQWNWQTLFLVYLFFEVGNTMFSSEKDMEGAIGLLIAVAILLTAFFILGARVQIDMIEKIFTPEFSLFFKKMSIVLAIPVTIDGMITFLFTWIGRK